MSKSLNPRIEADIKQVVSDIAGQEDTLKKVAAELIQIGIFIRKSEAEPKIQGPLGIPRPFAEISLGDQTAELRTEIDSESYEELVKHFDNKPNTAAKEALRLGVLAVAGEKFQVKGPAGDPRPFAEINLSFAERNDIKNIVSELQDRI